MHYILSLHIRRHFDIGCCIAVFSRTGQPVIGTFIFDLRAGNARRRPQAKCSLATASFKWNTFLFSTASNNIVMLTIRYIGYVRTQVLDAHQQCCLRQQNIGRFDDFARFWYIISRCLIIMAVDDFGDEQRMPLKYQLLQIPRHIDAHKRKRTASVDITQIWTYHIFPDIWWFLLICRSHAVSVWAITAADYLLFHHIGYHAAEQDRQNISIPRLWHVLYTLHLASTLNFIKKEAYKKRMPIISAPEAAPGKNSI